MMGIMLELVLVFLGLLLILMENVWLQEEQVSPILLISSKISISLVNLPIMASIYSPKYSESPSINTISQMLKK